MNRNKAQSIAPLLLFYLVICCLVILLMPCLAGAESEKESSLAKASQNPVGNMISVPFENNVHFGLGPSNATVYNLLVKPVLPVNLGKFNLINRLTIPVIYTEGQDKKFKRDDVMVGEMGPSGFDTGSTWGLGDITYQGFLSPAKPGKAIWGVGPALVFPSASDDRFGTRKWSGGVAAVVLAMPGKWVVGCLAQNVWSFAGDDDAGDVNSFLFQYFINYNMENGWYISTTPLITANWEAKDSDDRWTVPFGAAVGKIVRIGKLPVDLKLGGYWNAVKPDFAPDWSMQFTIKFLFPK